jgi:hypothetical protein
VSEHAPPAFDSPLRARLRTVFSEIGFGAVTLDADIAALRRDLDGRLFATFDALPEPLLSEAHAILRAYSGGDGDFFRLFYVPIWSFLHWVPRALPGRLDPALLGDARTAHALALFLHLWDDHLCDGQLSVDLLRLQMRTVAWGRCAEAMRRLCERAGCDPRLAEHHAGTYLSSLHRAPAANDADAYCDRFVRQIALWTVVPHALGHVSGGPTAAAALRRAVERFGVAWRLLDDVQDVHLDVLADTRSAVWIALDDAGRDAWALCGSRSRAAGEMEPESWSALCAAARGTIRALLARIAAELGAAAEAARAGGWSALAHELDQCRTGLA